MDFAVDAAAASATGTTPEPPLIEHAFCVPLAEAAELQRRATGAFRGSLGHFCAAAFATLVRRYKGAGTVWAVNGD